MSLRVSVKMNRTALKALEEAQRLSAEAIALELVEEVKQAEVMPYRTGNLQNTTRTEKTSHGMKIVHEAEYAQQTYFHPEYQFSKEHNANARGRWWDDWISGDKGDFRRRIARVYRRYARRYVE